MTDLRTVITRSYGVSGEDADKIIRLVAEETMARYLESQANQPEVEPQRRQPITVVFNAEIDEEAIVERVTDLIVPVLQHAARDRRIQQMLSEGVYDPASLATAFGDVE